MDVGEYKSDRDKSDKSDLTLILLSSYIKPSLCINVVQCILCDVKKGIFLEKWLGLAMVIN